MRLRDFIVILVACGAGYFGGIASRQSPVEAAAPDVIRATRFELVDSSGAPAATWESGPNGGTHLSFLRANHAALEIAILPDGRPVLNMSGRDGKRRIVMELDQSDKPMLGMGDERWEGRVALGFMPPDTWPYSNWDHWGLLFRAFGSEHAVVGMGTTNTPNNPAEPFLRIGGRSIRWETR
jgi:hypothetical protein